ncbi:Neur_chan_memb domain-containing protein [Caenorhabditis elegans]|uniref:Neur_chan_memb domain-containing protein n=1 Tax=Caenorhabditis elegans TaxID=6239 RepID=O45191_CAEEL|nr:Neur_chan_memb domain-containing protein [Caenorhabditis elegans]CCD71426.2 Neur_chan_memb domain-containing protein [Caenorhabditis elegans]|eukprot:NP_508676.3 Uncharacterized protein CELE_T22B2.5 [Caenorhabditis elegans]
MSVWLDIEGFDSNEIIERLQLYGPSYVAFTAMELTLTIVTFLSILMVRDSAVIDATPMRKWMKILNCEIRMLMWLNLAGLIMTIFPDTAKSDIKFVENVVLLNILIYSVVTSIGGLGVCEINLRSKREKYFRVIFWIFIVFIHLCQAVYVSLSPMKNATLVASACYSANVLNDLKSLPIGELAKQSTILCSELRGTEEMESVMVEPRRSSIFDDSSEHEVDILYARLYYSLLMLSVAFSTYHIFANMDKPESLENTLKCVLHVGGQNVSSSLK